jgi:transcriptional regulator with XRE-family HTH domain
VTVSAAPIAAGRVGARLLQVLQARGWTLGRLARETEARGQRVSLSQLSLLTRGGIDQPRLATIRKICMALDLPPSVLTEPDVLTGGTESSGHGHFGITTLVEVVMPVRGGQLVQTGERVAVTTSQLEGRERLLAAVITGGGMAPHVLIGDKVVFDPDSRPRPRQLALLLHVETVLCAWYVINDYDEASYRLADGSWLRPEQVSVVGTVVEILRSPPEYLG